jgi:hypothetical protein
MVSVEEALPWQSESEHGGPPSPDYDRKEVIPTDRPTAENNDENRRQILHAAKQDRAGRKAAQLVETCAKVIEEKRWNVRLNMLWINTPSSNELRPSKMLLMPKSKTDELIFRPGGKMCNQVINFQTIRSTHGM